MALSNELKLPVNLRDFALTAGDDVVAVKGAQILDSGLPLQGLVNAGKVSTRLGDDRIEVDLQVQVIENAPFAVLVVDGLANVARLGLGGGDDTIRSTVNVVVDTATLIDIDAIDNDAPGASLVGSTDDDRFEAVLRVDAVADGNITGAAFDLGAGLIRTGGDDDTVFGKTLVQVGDGGRVTVSGIDDGVVRTGHGDDLVRGHTTILLGEFADAVFADGIGGATIRSGSGDDRVEGGLVIDTGDLAFLDEVGSISAATVVTGSGDDDVEAITDIIIGASSAIVDAFGVNDSTIDTGSGDDTVRALLDVRAGASNQLFDLNGIAGSDIFTDSGDDEVEGRVAIDGTDFVRAEGNGIDAAVIDTGTGNDRVVGIGAEIAVGGIEGGGDVAASFGISASEVVLGAGADEVFARGVSGGVDDVALFGKGGIDTFDLHSGTGTVDGGTGSGDTLILSGGTEDFTFIRDGAVAATITDRASGGSVTNLAVIDVESFVLDDVTLMFDELPFIN